MLKEYLKELNIEPTDEMMKKFDVFSKMLLEWNEKLNLTAITEPEEIEIKHFADSLTILKTNKLNDGMSLIDIGCGAGFPSFPIKFALPDTKIVQLDSLNKRVNFLNAVSEELGLKGINAIHCRAEEGGRNKDLREKFDIASARAVASLPTLIELCVPFVKMGGYFIAMKGSDTDEEINSSKNALKLLGCEIEDVLSLSLPKFEHKRNIIVIKKNAPTEKRFPRNAPKPVKQPL